MMYFIKPTTAVDNQNFLSMENVWQNYSVEETKTLEYLHDSSWGLVIEN